MKKIINSLFMFILGGIIFGSIVYATTYYANDVTYTPTDANWEVNNVNDALNDLYKKNNIYTESNHTISFSKPTDSRTYTVTVTQTDTGNVVFTKTIGCSLFAGFSSTTFTYSVGKDTFTCITSGTEDINPSLVYEIYYNGDEIGQGYGYWSGNSSYSISSSITIKFMHGFYKV